MSKATVGNEDKPNRMDRRRMETRAKLLKATLSLVIKKGIEKTTMDDITEKADLGRRTLYYHFGSKEECIIAAAAQSYTKIAAAADQSAHTHEDPAIAVAVAEQLVIRKLLEAPITERLIDYPRFLATALRSSISDFVYQDLQLGVEQGRFEPILNGPLLDTSVMWILVGFLIETIENKLSVEESLNNFTQMHLVFLGLGREEARQVASKATALIA